MKIFRKNWRAISSILIFVLCAAVIMTVWLFQNELSISIGIGCSHAETIGLVNDSAHYRYKTAYTSDGIPSDEGLEKLIKDEYAECVIEEEEGAVLLQNKNGLPLANGAKVSLFGHAAAQPLYRARSGGAWTDGQENLLNFHDAMKDAGFSINEKLYDAYASSKKYRGGKNGGTSSPETQFLLGEEEKSFYTDELKQTFKDYKDAAIVVFAREGGETRDLPLEDVTGVPHLALHQEEKDLLEIVKAGGFDKIIVLLNTTNVMEVGWLDEYNVNACMWIGGPGLRGFEGVANLIKGKANPSGKLVSTYAKNSLSAPALVNFGDIEFTNYNDLTYADQAQFEGKLVTYAEGIYQGYKYYETRYEDCVLNRFGASDKVGSSTGTAWSYANEISYPFGHGLSYTTFTKTLKSVVYDDDSDEFTITVNVKNTGDVAGKEVVEVYVQTPYGEYEKTNNVEKSAINLVGFGKTSSLGPNEDEDVEVKVDRYLLASYDCNNAKTYYLSEGMYYFAIGDNVHDALNNVLACKGATGMVNFDGTSTTGNILNCFAFPLLQDVETYSKTKATGETVTNRFDDGDLNYWVKDSVTYLTRQDWKNTYPTKTTTTAITEDMLYELDGYTYKKPENAKSIEDFTLGVDSGIKFVDMYGLSYDDPKWETFLNQLTIDDMVSILDDNFCTRGVESVAKPWQLNNDGPDGNQQSYKFGDHRGSTCYPIESILSSTFNTELAKNRGKFLGEDNLYTGQVQSWSPAADIQRTPYSGRNYEYYSEDPIVNYLFLAVEVPEMQAKGVNVALKHFCGNDMEANRYGVCTFMTEQTLREVCMRGFESAFTIGGALGVMTGYNRIGCTYIGHSIPLQIEVLTGEWGFNGVIICDAVCGKSYQHPVEMQIAGNDMYCINIGQKYHADNKIRDAIYANDDGYLLESLRETNHQFYYSFVRSQLVNGLDHTSTVKCIMPWWEGLILTVDIILGVITAGFIALAILGKYVFKEA